MAEATEDAVFLIATSYQALGRASTGNDQTMLCNCTVVLVFAAFFVEANLSHILDVMDDYENMRRDVGIRHPGLYPKLAWFYNKWIARSASMNKETLYAPEYQEQVYAHFPGLRELVNFRNDVAHGKIMRPLANATDAPRLRQAAKAAVDRLFRIAGDAGHDIPRAITYQMAVSSAPESSPA